MTAMNERIEQIEAREKAATKGPWFQHQDWIDMGVPDASHTISNSSEQYGGKFIASAGLHSDVKHGNANFIAHAREDVPHLLAVVREQQAQLDKVASVAANLEWRAEQNKRNAATGIYDEQMQLAADAASSIAIVTAGELRAALTASHPETES